MLGCAYTGVSLPVLSSGPAHLCLISTGTASFQAHTIFALIYYNSFLLLPCLLVFLLSFVLQCLARMILPDLKSDLTLTCDSLLFSGGGPPHTWMDSFPWPTLPPCTSWFWLYRKAWSTQPELTTPILLISSQGVFLPVELSLSIHSVI